MDWGQNPAFDMSWIQKHEILPMHCPSEPDHCPEDSHTLVTELVQYNNTIVFISQNKPLSGYKRNYSDNALGITVHKRRRLNISSGCFIDVGLCRLYTLTERTRGEHIPHKHKERNK